MKCPNCGCTVRKPRKVKKKRTYKRPVRRDSAEKDVICMRVMVMREHGATWREIAEIEDRSISWASQAYWDLRTYDFYRYMEHKYPGYTRWGSVRKLDCLRAEGFDARFPQDTDAWRWQTPSVGTP